MTPFGEVLSASNAAQLSNEKVIVREYAALEPPKSNKHEIMLFMLSGDNGDHWKLILVEIVPVTIMFLRLVQLSKHVLKIKVSGIISFLIVCNDFDPEHRDITVAEFLKPAKDISGITVNVDEFENA